MKEINKLLEQYDKEIYTLIHDKMDKDLTIKVGQEQKKLYDYYVSRDWKKLKESATKWSTLLQAYNSSMDMPEEYVAFCLGRMSGTTTVFNQLMKEAKRVSEYERTHPNTKYNDAIFAALAKADYMQHKELADRLSIDKSQLTTIMKKIAGDNQQMILTSKVGKFKYYFLSEAGKKYYSSRIEKDNKQEIQELMDRLITRMKTSNREDFLKYAKERYEGHPKIYDQFFQFDALVNKTNEMHKNNRNIDVTYLNDNMAFLCLPLHSKRYVNNKIENNNDTRAFEKRINKIFEEPSKFIKSMR